MTATVPLQPETAGQVRPSATHRLVDTLLRLREIALVGVIAVLLIGTQVDNSRFLSEQGVKDLLLNAAILVLVACGEAVVVMTRNVDLSVGSILGVAAFATGDVLKGGGSVVVAVLAALAVGVAFGLLNGLLVSFGQVPSLVVTLGTLYIIRGVDSLWVGSRQITAADLSPGFLSFGHGGVGAVPWLALLAVVVLIATGVFLRNYRTGRDFYALGSNPEAARLAGTPVRRRIIQVYILCGALAGLAGCLYMARFANVDSGTGSGFELTVVSAVVVGGVAFTGGSGSVYGAALGALLLTSINSMLPSLGISSVWVQAIDGFLLLLAIAVDRVVAVRIARTLRKRSARHV
ncbi:ABC transporter permease [Jatrophihabitans telluris]|uniref:Autoinducer 2 import system permease protein LsrC n=1 Tax=Jatrophihabitans telluris TaxID=2038343 RepID=A0ABY4QV03_9ACTN|nr:ABC transporter permease [Jatrophihabitans telluris]UQX87440.1 ABC transporter permease [Jatrophihabitans telluris]